MIAKIKHLCYVLRTRASVLEQVIKDLDKYYYLKEEIKKDSQGRDKVKNGVVQKRKLFPSTSTLKTLQRRINRYILKKLSLPEYAFGGINDRDNINNALQHVRHKYKFSTDIRNFFPSIRHDKVYEMFISHGFSPTVSMILTKMTTYKGMLPQGAPTSPLIANLVFVKTGARLQQFCTEHSLTLTSFVDDITISSDVDFKELVPEILSTIQEDGYKISHSKTYYKTKDAVVTGLVLTTHGLRLPERLQSKLLSTEINARQRRGLQIYADRVEKLSHGLQRDRFLKVV